MHFLLAYYAILCHQTEKGHSEWQLQYVVLSFSHITEPKMDQQQQQHQPKFATSIPCLVLNNMFMNLCRFNVKNHNSAQSTCQPPPIFRLVVRPKRLQKSTREGHAAMPCTADHTFYWNVAIPSLQNSSIEKHICLHTGNQKNNATHILSFTQLKGGLKGRMKGRLKGGA